MLAIMLCERLPEVCEYSLRRVLLPPPPHMPRFLRPRASLIGRDRVYSFFFGNRSEMILLETVLKKELNSCRLEMKYVQVRRNNYTLKQNTRFRECYSCFGCETMTVVVRILVIFRNRPVFSQINRKVSARASH